MSDCEVCASPRSRLIFEKLDHRFTRCDDCGLERISPQPSDETLAAIYGAHYYEAWGLHGNEATVAALKKRTFKYVLDKLPGAPAGTKLLDCGAATGFLLEVARDLGYEPYGLELSEFGAKEIARKFGADRVFCGELPHAAFPSAKPGDFGVITMCDYIEHVRDPRQTLALARKLIAEGGTLAITTPDAGSPSRRVLGTGWTHYKIEHLFYFNQRNLERLLKEVGFGSVKFYPLWKSLTLDYISHQFEVYPHPALTQVARGIRRLTPARIRSFPLPFTTGELLAVARA
ncbi:MAG TPA: class I SAM-dependent methyltransferase [Kofleriaceae bacterium]|nr:class I SAM-dependent methyltransferase [Kofleriaceae bacterium]